MASPPSDTVAIKSLVDLHCHSTASDGRLAPADVVARAADAGVTLLALTDHDSIDGIAEARVAAAEADIELIAGTEISASWQKRTLHVVGLGIDTESDVLKAGLAEHQQMRVARAEKMAAKLEKAGLSNAAERAASMTADGQITRTHFARLLVEDGLVKDMNGAFKKYLKPGKPGYVGSDWCELEDVIRWIHAAGGKAVLAHPFGYNMTASWRRRMLSAFSEEGGDAMEVCCGNSTADEITQATKDADAYELMGSIGSDFHGPDQHWLALGKVQSLPKSVQPVWTTLSQRASY